MSRREIVLLVSRAIAIPIIIGVLNTLLVYIRLSVSMLSHPLSPHNSPTELIFEFARLLLTLLVGVLFWKCGPTVERLLLPAGTQQESDASI
jgi:hypothetical protein